VNVWRGGIGERGTGEGVNGGRVARGRGVGVGVWVWGGRGGKKKLKKSEGTQKFCTPPNKKKSNYYYDDCASNIYITQTLYVSDM